MTNIGQNITKIDSFKEDYLNKIADKEVFIQNFHELPIILKGKTEENQVKLKSINQVR